MDIALQILTTVSTFIFVASLTCRVLLVLVILVLATLGRVLSVNSRYLLWSVLLVSLVTPMGLKLYIPGLAPLEPEEALATTGLDAADWSLEDAPARVAAAVNSSPVQSENAVVSSTAVNATGLLPWRELLSLFWLGGVLVVLGAMMVVSRR